jgi:hypothetical protein
MPPSDFVVSNETELDSALAAIADGSTDTAYTIQITGGPIALANDAAVALPTGSTLQFEGDALITTGVTFTVSGAITLDLDYTGTITLQGGSVDNVALGYTGEIYDPASHADVAINDGTIVHTAGGGGVYFDTGTVQNGWDGTTAALISGAGLGVAILSSGLVQNAGTISATAGSPGIGVYLGAGTLDNGTDTATGAQITSDGFGVEVYGAGTIDNDATISGATTGVYLGSGTVENGDSADTTATITGSGAEGVWVGTGTGIVDNDGTINAPGSAATSIGVYLEAGGTLNNGNGADAVALVSGTYEGVELFAAGDVDNDGTIQADGSDAGNDVIAAWLENGGTVQNLGSLSLIDGVDWGVLTEGAAGAVQNAGTIAALGGMSEGIAVDLEAGGTVDNLAGGTIDGALDGVRVAMGAAGPGALVENDGTIIGVIGVDFASGATMAAGTLVNDGLIQSDSLVSPYAVRFGDGDERLVLESQGSFVGTVLGGTATGATTTMAFADGTTGTFTWAGDDTGTVTDEAGSFDFSAFETFVVDPGADWTLDGTATDAQTIQFQLGSSPTVLRLTAPAAIAPDAVQAVIGNFGTGGTIDLLNVADDSITFRYDSSDSLLDVLSGGGLVATLDLPGPFASDSFTPTTDTAGTGTFITTDVMPCFTTGTAIDTARGAVCVQDLRVGDRVVCAGGGTRPVIWIGQRRLRIADHPRPAAVMPVRIRRGAFAEGQPRRDLLLSPDHAVFTDDVLIPVKHLIDGAAIVQEPLEAVEYWHVELDRHDVLFAEGLPAESYLETGNRAAFANGGGTMSLHPVFGPANDAACLIWEALGYAPLVTTGEAVRRVTERVARRTQERCEARSAWPRAVA